MPTPSLVLPKPAAEALDLLYQHRLLSTPQVRQILIPSYTDRAVVRVMDELKSRALVNCVRSRTPTGAGHRLWFLTQLGAKVVEAVPNRAETRRRLLTPALAAGQFQAHTLAVNDVGVSFLAAARKRGHDFGPWSWRHEVGHDLGQHARRGRGMVIADAVLRYWMGLPDGRTAVRYRFIEVDRGNRLVDDAAGKLARYARLKEIWAERRAAGDHGVDEEAPSWPLLYRHFPGIIVVLANAGRANLRRRLASLLALCRSDPEISARDGISVFFTFFEELVERGPFAPIFHRLGEQQTVNWLGDVEDAPLSGQLEIADG